MQISEQSQSRPTSDVTNFPYRRVLDIRRLLPGAHLPVRSSQLQLYCANGPSAFVDHSSPGATKHYQSRRLCVLSIVCIMVFKLPSVLLITATKLGAFQVCKFQKYSTRIEFAQNSQNEIKQKVHCRFGKTGAVGRIRSIVHA